MVFSRTLLCCPGFAPTASLAILLVITLLEYGTYLLYDISMQRFRFQAEAVLCCGKKGDLILNAAAHTRSLTQLSQLNSLYYVVV